MIYSTAATTSVNATPPTAPPAHLLTRAPRARDVVRAKSNGALWLITETEPFRVHGLLCYEVLGLGHGLVNTLARDEIDVLAQRDALRILADAATHADPADIRAERAYPLPWIATRTTRDPA